MSNIFKKQETDQDDDVDWLEKAIVEEHIKFYDYSHFNNIQEISSGSVGNIFRANWKDSDTVLVLKSSYKLTVQEIVNELKIQREVDFHANILRFYGISKLRTGLIHQMNKYLLVMEYADGGALHTYLRDNFHRLSWNDKYRLAIQLANAISCIHNEDIVHGDLHSYNILVHQNNIKLTNFGLSRKMAEDTHYDDIFINTLGIIPYMDPQSLYSIYKLQDESKPYELNKKSDIYSLGVILWQISSGYRPFYPEGIEYDIDLVKEIKKGQREEIIENTPIKYSNLYTACWDDNPDKRPNIYEVILSLKEIENSC
ncbi:kinase-like domain-containing protein [Glomus cerebriforme]|uniref:Kinase-like domain-containing protein n=1 Tax=Glomus cerebriforme TaxID=658196 RepID=A0A397TFG9_9GLOM|nr:kinase-like domain-containing protein [Glomus cerebriforme]